MKCEACGVGNLKVLNSRKKPGRVYRRRECPHCGHRCTSAEFLLPEGVSNFNSLEEFIHQQMMSKARQMISHDLKERLKPYLEPELKSWV